MTSRPIERRWRAASTVMVRAPALPIETFFALAAPGDPTGPTGPNGPSDSNGPNGPCHPRGDDDRLEALLHDPYIALALRVASSSIATALDAGERTPALRRALRAYLIRMSTRPTPFGLFAGVALATWGDRTSLDLPGRPSLRRARPDMAWLLALCERLERDPDLRGRLVLRAHPALVQRGDRVLLAGAVSVAEARDDVSVRATPVVLAALETCRAGAPYAAVVERLCRAPGGDRRRAQALVETLLERGLLTTDLRPPLTCSPVHHVMARLRAAASPHIAPAYGALGELLAGLAAWEAAPDDAALGRWPRLRAAAHALVPRDPAFQVDAGFGGAAHRLPRGIAHEAARAADLLLRLSPRPQGAPQLAEFRRRFEEAYGPWRDVPLMEVLDEDLGLGMPPPEPPAPETPARDRLLLQLAASALQTGARAVELDEASITALERAAGGPGLPPASLDLFCAVAAESAQALDEGRFLLVLSTNGTVTPAGRAFGRFGHLFSAAGTAFVRDRDGHASGMGDSGDAIPCELLYEPTRSRSANVMVRPLSRPRAVVVNGGFPEGAEIVPLDELALGLGHGRLRLRWPRRGVDVEVAPLHMLNPALAPPLARLLQAVSYDREATVAGFSWGAAEHLPFRPRLVVGRVVLRPAEWTLDRRFFDALARDRGAAREAVRLPRFIHLGSNDELLLLDLDSAMGMELLLAAGLRLAPGTPHGREARAETTAALHAGVTVTVQEALPGPEHAFARAADGHRMIELVVPLVCERRETAERTDLAPPRPVRSAIARHQRSRPPGSEWLYAKLFLPRLLADDLIGGAMLSLVEELAAARWITSWFFVRYADPAFHIRLRLAGEPVVLEHDVLPRVCAWASGLRERGVIDRFSFDCYEREVERYGGPEALAVVEPLFSADSLAVAQLLGARRRLSPPLEWRDLPIATVDDLLDSLGLAPAARVELYRRHADRRPHAARFRAERLRLRALMTGDHQADGPPAVLRSILAARRTVAAEVAGRLADLDARALLVTPLPDILRSIAHMHCNRLCGVGGSEARILALAGMTLASLTAWPPERDA